MNKRHYEHTLPNIRGSLSNTYVRVPVGRSIPVMTAYSVPVSLSSGNAVSRSFRSDLMPAGDNRMSVCKHDGT